MREVNVSSTEVQAKSGPRNQPTEEEIGDVQEQETTGAASEDRPNEQGENVVHDQETTGAASEDQPNEQGEGVVQQSEGDDEDHAQGKEAGQEKVTDPRPLERHQLTPEDLDKVYQSIGDR